MGQPSPPQVEVKGVSKTFRTHSGDLVEALHRIDLEVQAHRFVSIIGPSGCGKSTLFNIIAGLDMPSSGQVLIDGVDRTGQLGVVSYMLQKDLLLPWRNVVDNVILGLELGGISRREAREIALPLLEQYGLEAFERRYPSQLSGGMRQRVALLRTLLLNREIILLDEPFGALDAQTRSQMQEWLLQLWEDLKKTVILVTHDIDEAIYLSDTVHVMSARPGRLLASLEVPLGRPRSPSVLTRAEFVEMKEVLRGMLARENRLAGIA